MPSKIKKPAKPTPKNLQKLWDVVTAWRDKQQVTCPESLYQMDSVQVSYYQLADDICKVIGYVDRGYDD